MQTESIAYIGRREQHRDSTYGTGDWVKWQVKRVAVPIAAKMLRHPDVYVVGPVAEHDGAVDVVLEAPEKSEKEIAGEAIQQALDAVQAMEADALHEFAQRNFNMKLDRRKSAASLRIDAQQLIHRFGLPQ